MATGLARGARDRGRRIAFGDGDSIKWHPHAREVFRNNPNVAPPGDEGASDLEWIAHYAGRRLYNAIEQPKDRWLWNMDFRPTPGEMFFDAEEVAFGEKHGSGFIVIEPNLPYFKSIAINKQWAPQKYEKIAYNLFRDGRDVRQFVYPGIRNRLRVARHVKTPSFRHALAVLARAALYIGPEGGMHHGAAAVGVPAVVIFGGCCSPQVTGYPNHTNLTGGAEACGMKVRCRHCRDAMERISVGEVWNAAMAHLGAQAA